MDRQRTAIIVTDLMGEDAMFQVVSEEDFKVVTAFNPTRDYPTRDAGGNNIVEQVLDGDKYQEMIFEYFYDKENDKNNEKVLEEWFIHTYCTKNIDLSKYDIIGMLTLPGG